VQTAVWHSQVDGKVFLNIAALAQTYARAPLEYDFFLNSTCRLSSIGFKATPLWCHNLAMSVDCKYNYNTI